MRNQYWPPTNRFSGWHFKEDHAGKGEALIALAQYNEAILTGEQATQLDPAYATAYSLKAKAMK